MNRNARILLALSAAILLGACAPTPPERLATDGGRGMADWLAGIGAGSEGWFKSVTGADYNPSEEIMRTR